MYTRQPSAVRSRVPAKQGRCTCGYPASAAPKQAASEGTKSESTSGALKNSPPGAGGGEGIHKISWQMIQNPLMLVAVVNVHVLPRTRARGGESYRSGEPQERHGGRHPVAEDDRSITSPVFAALPSDSFSVYALDFRADRIIAAAAVTGTRPSVVRGAWCVRSRGTPRPRHNFAGHHADGEPQHPQGKRKKTPMHGAMGGKRGPKRGKRKEES